jgi:hypothetical protein
VAVIAVGAGVLDRRRVEPRPEAGAGLLQPLELVESDAVQTPIAELAQDVSRQRASIVPDDGRLIGLTVSLPDGARLRALEELVDCLRSVCLVGARVVPSRTGLSASARQFLAAE